MKNWIKKGRSAALRPENKFFAALAGTSIVFLAYLFLHEVLTWNWIKQSRLPPTELILNQDTALAVDARVGMENLRDVYGRGAQDFVTCTICHSELPGEHRFGPSLFGVIDTRIGRHLTSGAYPYDTSALAGPSRDPYRYSAAFHRLNAEGLIWSLPALWSFVYDQGQFVEGSRMPFLGLKSIGDAKEAQSKVHSVLHYLAWACKPDCGTDLTMIWLDIDGLTATDPGAGMLWTSFRVEPYAFACELAADAKHAFGADPAVFMFPDDALSADLPAC